MRLVDRYHFWVLLQLNLLLLFFIRFCLSVVKMKVKSIYIYKRGVISILFESQENMPTETSTPTPQLACIISMSGDLRNINIKFSFIENCTNIKQHFAFTCWANMSPQTNPVGKRKARIFPFENSRISG